MAIGIKYYGTGDPARGAHPVSEYSWKAVPFGTNNAHIDWSTGKILSPLYENDSEFPQGTMAKVPGMPDVSKNEKDKGLVSVDGSDTPDYLSRKVSGSIVDRKNGSVCLKGEENAIQKSGTVYGVSAHGVKGFFDIGEIDSSPDGRMVGPRAGEGGMNPSGDDVLFDGKGGSMQIWIKVRTSFKKKSSSGEDDGATPEYEVLDFYRLFKISPFGRIISVSEEMPVKAVSASSSGTEKYGVKPVFDDGGRLSSLEFGTRDQIDSEDYPRATKTVGTVQCPNASS